MKFTRCSMLALIAVVLCVHANATERYHNSTLKFVYPLGSGDFVLGFDVDTAQCTGAGVPKYVYVTVGQNGVTAEGSKKMYAAAMLALANRMTVYFAFDDATQYCYLNRLTIESQ